MKFPWTKRREETAVKFDRIHSDLCQLKDSLITVQNMLCRPAPTLGPLVCVLVEAWAADHMANMGLTTLGVSGRAKRGENIRLTTYVPLENGRVTIFADFEQVQIRGVYLGNDLLHVGGDWAPVLSFRKWDVGVNLNVICEPRGS